MRTRQTNTSIDGVRKTIEIEVQISISVPSNSTPKQHIDDVLAFVDEKLHVY